MLFFFTCSIGWILKTSFILVRGYGLMTNSSRADMSVDQEVMRELSQRRAGLLQELNNYSENMRSHDGTVRSRAATKDDTFGVIPVSYETKT